MGLINRYMRFVERFSYPVQAFFVMLYVIGCTLLLITGASLALISIMFTYQVFGWVGAVAVGLVFAYLVSYISGIMYGR